MSQASAALYQSDRALVDGLLQPDTEPTDENLVTAARLFSRYVGSTQDELITDIERAMAAWGFSITDTQCKARAIWGNGYRPQAAPSIDVGSGADTNQQS